MLASAPARVSLVYSLWHNASDACEATAVASARPLYGPASELLPSECAGVHEGASARFINQWGLVSHAFEHLRPHALNNHTAVVRTRTDLHVTKPLNLSSMYMDVQALAPTKAARGHFGMLADCQNGWDMVSREHLGWVADGQKAQPPDVALTPHVRPPPRTPPDPTSFYSRRRRWRQFTRCRTTRW